MLCIKTQDGAEGTLLAGEVICGGEQQFDRQEEVGSRRVLKSRGKYCLHFSN